MIGQLRAPDAASVTRRSTLMRKDGSEVAVETTLWLAPTGRDGTSWMITLVRDITTPWRPTPTCATARGRCGRPSRRWPSPRTGSASPATSTTP